ncbi:FAD-binding domain-containing protein [Paraphaeosphaeria sporulosa]|uniref:Delta(24)-sterol reductase n=1 Tax=Paraphaeosphaeria sporulosa TaxID=1460663 RepID=A0A177CV00_9PLEO|nr:FAD-binding domain-containing protein [Paraphaeosphaeria sporulosa]OAG10579.1 FAD-binding domain-containing protein [Paraphaeosphaeria sporulosa]
MDNHDFAVERIRSRIVHFYNTKTAFRVYHGSTNSTRHANFDRASILDVSALNNVLSIDPATKTAVVEPNVPMDALVRETMKVGLLPPVVMEFPGITVGGGFVGTAGESSSFKYGFFDRTVLSAEVVLANGDVAHASSTDNQELFEGLRGSFGTLGVLTSVKLQLIDMKSHVEVTYHPTTSISSAMSQLRAETASATADYIDGILFSPTSGAIITGRLTSTPSPTLPTRTFSRPWDPWFYLHAWRLASSPSPTTECVPIQDYLFRYDRGAFWMGSYGFAHFRVPFTWLTRLLLDYFMHTRVMYHALHASGHTDRYIIHDIAFPAPNAAEFAEYVDKTYGIYPLWLCPVRKDGRSSMGHPRSFSGEVPGKTLGAVYEGAYINVGVWGPYPSDEAEYVRANREIEAKARSLGGLKWLYSRVFYTEDEWWSIYDKERYEVLRAKFNAESLPSVWEKVRDRGPRREFGTGWKAWVKRVLWKSEVARGLYGVWKAMGGGDYVLSKKGKTA